MTKRIEDQLFQVAPFPLTMETPKISNGDLFLKLKSDHGKTKWIKISPDQFKAIEVLLCD